MAPFRPMFQGKPVELAGFFTGGDDANYIVVNAEQEAAAYGVIFHEYAHYLTLTALGEIPLWANEGLAEFYQTFAANGSKGAILGKPRADNLRLLERTTLLPLSQLIAVAYDSPMYNEGDRRGLFYAQSWAFVHYLTFGGAERVAQWRRFLSAVGQGTDGADAFTEIFGRDTSALDRELRSYIRQKTTVMQIDFDEKIVAGTPSRGVTIAEEDAAGYLGELMAFAGRVDDARMYLRKVIDGGREAPRAIGALGRLELRAGNDELALSLLERAVARAPDLASAQRSYGLILARQIRAGLDAPALESRARTAFTRALEAEPANAATMAALAELEMGTASGTDKAVTLMREVVKALPGRDDYQLLMAQALLLQGDYPAASSFLAPLVARGRTPQITEAARRLSARVAEQLDLASSAIDSPLDLVRAAPGLRQVQAGETRVLGAFTTVECFAAELVLHIDTADGSLTLAATRLEDVEFLTYRRDTPRIVSCGPQRPSYRVLATFRKEALAIPGTTIDNRAVAIEFLPDGDVPR